MAKKNPDGKASSINPDKEKQIAELKKLADERFSKWSRVVMRDVNRNPRTPWFKRYTKDKIINYLFNPAVGERELRAAIRYIYGASSHFRRLIQYFVALTDLSYIVEPYKTDPTKANTRTTNLNYRKVLNTLSAMDIKNQFPDVLTVCLREDVCYCTLWVSSENITLQRLPSDYCTITTVEGNVPNVTFDFSYFDSRCDLLSFFPEEFQQKYQLYRTARAPRWMELSAPNSFAIKCNSDILEYALPPFAGILGELFDIEEYKQLELAKTALENYAMLAMMLPMQDDGTWGIDLDKATDFWTNLDQVLPDEIGSVLTPMDIKKISFERSNASENDTIAQAEQNLFTAAGVSSLIFNNTKASANALLLSMKADQAITYGIVKSIERAINRFIQSFNYGKYFRVNFLDVSFVNRKEVGDAYLKAASYGLPTISAYAASQGIGQAELDAMAFLEGTVLELQKRFKPIQSSSQMSSDSLNGNGATEEGGAPEKDITELTDSGEQSREDKDDW